MDILENRGEGESPKQFEQQKRLGAGMDFRFLDY
tara:strand:- start:571 stop:672 length:102 start_codon:yes stop_codon:yes gene_type:complete